jgi:sulfate permease, SulP family
MATDSTNRLQTKNILSIMVSSLVTGLITVVLLVSFGTLVFANNLHAYVGRGIGFALFGGAVMGLFVALTSSYAGVISGPQGRTAAVLALIATAVARMMPENPLDEVFITIMVVLILTAVLTGVIFLIMGLLNLGEFIRFIPYPVVGGFIGGTGWLMLKGAFGLAVGESLSGLLWSGGLFEGMLLFRWLPVLVYAVFMLVVVRRLKHHLTLPALIGMAFALFYAALLVTGTSLSEARAHGWLLTPGAESQLWLPIMPSDVRLTAWPVVFTQIGAMGSVIFISAVSLLLNASGIELASHEDIDFNRELVTTGVANVLSGLGGGLVGFHSLSLTVLAQKLGGKNRLTGVVTALLSGGVLLLGTNVLGFVPVPVVGAVLMYFGISFLVEWVLDARLALPRADYVQVLIIILVTGLVGFLEGVAVGILLAVVFFVISYSQANTIKHELSGATFTSNVDRAARQRFLLRENGDALYILILQGFIFFGTANNLFNKVRSRVANEKLVPLQYVLLDFSRVIELDSSALNSFLKMRYLLESHKVILAVAGLAPRLKERFFRIGFSEDDTIRFFEDLDHGMEWCEDLFLKNNGLDPSSTLLTIQALFAEVFPNREDVNRLLSYFEHIAIPEGAYIIRQGDEPEYLYYLEIGQVSVVLERDPGPDIRLRKMGSGTVLGEMGFYMKMKGTASVIATKPTIVYRLSLEKEQELQANDPELAAALHKFIVSLVSEKLAFSNRVIRALN